MMVLRDYVDVGPMGKRRLPVLANERDETEASEDAEDAEDAEDEVEAEEADDFDAEMVAGSEVEADAD
jgi:hypothetical protein